MTIFSQSFRKEIEYQALVNFVDAEFDLVLEDLPLKDGFHSFQAFGGLTIVIRPFISEKGLYLVMLDAWVDDKTKIEEAGIFHIDSFENGIVDYGELKTFNIL